MSAKDNCIAAFPFHDELLQSAMEKLSNCISIFSEFSGSLHSKCVLSTVNRVKRRASGLRSIVLKFSFYFCAVGEFLFSSLLSPQSLIADAVACLPARERL